MKNEPLVFQVARAKGKPHSYRQNSRLSSCPFCAVDELTNIYQKQGNKIWLRNKFSTLENTLQTVLIEDKDHNGDISTYTKTTNRELMKFSLSCFRKVKAADKFKSVVWYKNFGPHSGGSLSHPHMQIVGLEKVDAYKDIQSNNFTGRTLFKTKTVEVNIAQHPIRGYTELNFNLLNDEGIELWSDWLQAGAYYLLNIMRNGQCDSYNLFFYPRQDGGICAKYISRFASSPYFIGYKLAQVNDDFTIAKEADRLYNFYSEWIEGKIKSPGNYK